MHDICYFCRSTNVVEKTQQCDFTFNGNPVQVDIGFCQCLDCNAQFVSKEQVLENEKRITEAKQCSYAFVEV